MNRYLACAVVALGFLSCVGAQAKTEKTASPAKQAKTETAAKTAPATPAPAAKPAAAAAQKAPASKSDSAKLEDVLNAMDKTAAAFQSVEAEFEWDQFSKVVEETTVQKGVMFFRRQGNNIEMAADIRSTDDKPDAKYVLFTGGIVQVYQPKVDQVTKYSAGKNKADFESFLVLGFGGRGHDLAKSFDVRYGGEEQVAGVNTAKLELTPKAARVKNMFTVITLWIDPARGISVQQKFQESSGDYRLAKYSNIKPNQKLPDNAFKLKTTGKTRIVTPQG